jgi:hypothetical protein
MNLAKFNRKRLAGLIASWCVYAGLLWWLSYQDTHVCVLGILLLSSFTTLLSLYLVWKPLRTTTVALIAGLCLLGAPQSGSAQEQQDPFLQECVIAIVVIGIGIIVAIPLVRICKRCLPPTEPPAQPPATNSIPKTNAPPVTNSVPHHILPKLTDDSFSYYDVSSMTMSNTDTSGNPYRVWFTGTVQSSSNLNDWKNEVTINGWASSAEVITVYTVNGVAVCTNWTTLASGTNVVEIPSIDAAEPQKFFRVVP